MWQKYTTIYQNKTVYNKFCWTKKQQIVAKKNANLHKLAFITKLNLHYTLYWGSTPQGLSKYSFFNACP